MASFFITINILLGQSLWAKTYGGTSDDYACSITHTTDGGFAVAGYTYSFGAGEWDFQVLRLNDLGGLIWARTFGGTNNDVAYSVIQTTDGGYASAGYTKSFGAGGRDFLLIRLNSSGGLIWARTLGGTGDDEPYSVAQAADGGFGVAGKTESFGAGGYDFFVLKLNSAGSLEWARAFGGASADYGYSITQTTDGGFAVAGGTNSFGAGGPDFLVIRLNSDGSVVWAKTYGGPSGDIAYSIIQTSDGGFAVAGYTDSFGGGERFLVLKMDSYGNLSWARTFGMNWEDAYSIIQTPDGGFAVAGFAVIASAYDDFSILRLDGSGNLIWARTFGGSDYDDAYSIAQAADGGFAIAGETWTFDPLYCDMLILKVGPDGNYPNCVEPYSPPVNTVSPSVSLPSVGADCSPVVSSPNLTEGTQGPTIREICPPSELEEKVYDSRSGITWFPLSGGALFLSYEETPLRIYSSDGRLVFSCDLVRGQNRVSLDPGLYFWQAGQYKGKVGVR